MTSEKQWRSDNFETIELIEYQGDELYLLETEFPIEEKYQKIYDEGIIYAQIRASNNPKSHWTTDRSWLGDDDDGIPVWLIYHDHPGVYESDWKNPWEDTDRVPSVQKDKVVVYGLVDGAVTVEEIKSFKFDLKVILIPATEVVKMSTNSIDVNNLSKVIEYLELE